MWTVRKKKVTFDNACNPITEKGVRTSKDVVKGSLTLHSDGHVYRNGVLIHKWFVEDQPKDFDYKTACPKNLHKSTYHRFGCSLEPTAKSVYTLTNNEFIFNKSKPPPTIRHRDVMSNDDSTYLMLDREKKVACESGLKHILPHINEDPRKFRCLTSSIDHYRPPLPLIYTSSKKTTDQEASEAELAKYHEYNTACFKRCMSQFTEFGGAKKDGVETWADESGIYGNTCLRQTHPYYIKREAPYNTRLV